VVESIDYDSCAAEIGCENGVFTSGEYSGQSFFNGFELQFTGIHDISDVTSVSGLDPTEILFNDDTVWIGFFGGPRSPGQTTVLDVQFASAVPERASLTLLGASLFGLGAIRRRKAA
jgi:hypothetical protein